MMKPVFLIAFCCSILSGFSQVTPAPVEPPVNSTVEQQLENITENNEDMETEDDSYIQELSQYIKHPLNINKADENQLKDLRVLSDLQLQNFLRYRDLFGNFLSVYELQAVPGWDVATIQKLRPYVTVSAALGFMEDMRSRFKGGENNLLIRATQILEKSRGYRQGPPQTNSYYMGSPQRIFMRYKYNYKNLLQYGVTGDKDAGEQFFKGNQQKGFDFYSAHLFARNIGKIKALALGDFTVNLGQGLTSWMSIAFKKSPDIMAVKRQAPVLKPYSSPGEIFFHRGAELPSVIANGKPPCLAPIEILMPIL